MKISNDVAEVLERSQVNGKSLMLPEGQLDRKLYVSVNKVLEAMGGKWNRKAKAHLFERDPSAILENALLTGELVDPKKELQFFPTPSEVAQQLVKMANLQENDRVLEPSAGDGALIKEILKQAVSSIVAVEVDPARRQALDEILGMDGHDYDGVDMLITGDFMKMSTFDLGSFDRIIMNPPFTRQQDIEHVFHAFDMLKIGGILVAVVSESPFFRTTGDAQAFRSFLEIRKAEVIELPVGAFKESGTMVKTRIVKIRKI